MDRFTLDEMTPGEKLWLLAGELVRDQGHENVDAHHLASVLGQALACVTAYSTADPLNPRTQMQVMNCAEDAALDAQERFLTKFRDLEVRTRRGFRTPGAGVTQ